MLCAQSWRSTFAARVCSRHALRHARPNSTSVHNLPNFRGRARAGAATVTTGILGSMLFYGQESLRTDPQVQIHEDQRSPRQPTPLSSLVRTYIVYSLCSVPSLVDWSPTILATLSSVPGVRQITEAVIRMTFFSQFVGGETAQGTTPLLQQLRSENKGALFAYSVEVDEEEAVGKARATAGGTSIEQPMHKRIVEEMLRSIDVAADFEEQRRGGHKSARGRRTWVAVKLTAMLPNAQALVDFSSYLVKTRPTNDEEIPFPGCPHPTDLSVLDTADDATRPSSLTLDDLAALRALRDDLVLICTKAKERGVRVIVDAEYSWYQPAIDAFTLALMRQFNKLPSSPSMMSRIMTPKHSNAEDVDVQPLVYATFQAYLIRTPSYLMQSFKDAQNGNYALGVKLVRGAYHPHEVLAHPTSAALINDKETASVDIPAAAISDMRGVSSRLHTSPSISPEPAPPVWLRKEATDACYDACVCMLLGVIERSAHGGATPAAPMPTVGALFGTHNWKSCDVILDQLVKQGLAAKEPGENGNEVIRIRDDIAERVTLAQLYGMSDALTNHLVDRTRSTAPFVIKYVPYGALSEVMPYLSRRAIENKSVLGVGGAAEERRRAGAEICRRIFG